METQNQQLEQWRDALEQILAYYVDLPYRYGEVKTHLIISHDRNHFLLLHEGWENYRHVHGTLVHAEFRDDKIWIHYDGIEDGITDDLVKSGVPKQNIVLAFQPPHVRAYTDYAVA
jgi:XisI protein